jgi:hypothetical protein
VVAKPAGLAVGDLMLAWLGIDNTSNPASITPPSGFTNVINYHNGYMGSWLWWKVAAAADVSASDFTFTLAASKGGAMVLSAFSGVSGVSPLADYGAYGGSSPTNAPAWDLSISTTAPGQMLVLFGLAQVGGYAFSGYAAAAQNPASWAEAADINDASKSACAACGLASGVGATGNWSYSCSGSVRQLITGVALAESLAMPAILGARVW